MKEIKTRIEDRVTRAMASIKSRTRAHVQDSVEDHVWFCVQDHVWLYIHDRVRERVAAHVKDHVLFDYAMDDIDIILDRHFSKIPVKVRKLTDLKELLAKIIAEAEQHYNQFAPKDSKSYRAGFYNGFGLGFYAGLCKAAKICKGEEK